MAPSLPDLVDCARLAEDAAVLDRVYAIGDLPRLQDLLAEPTGVLSANFAFAKSLAGGAGATVTVEAGPRLVCQRCLKGFAFPVRAASQIEFAGADERAAPDSPRESYATQGGSVSLRDMAEEELLLALPLAPACSNPQTCGNWPPAMSGEAAGEDAGEASGGMRRPFAALQNLLKKT